jgi:hypothetical protein
VPPSASEGRIDLVTVVAVAVVAYCLTNIIHEGLGHGGACLLVGGKPQVLNAVFFQSAEEGMSAAAVRVLNAGGSVANLIAAAFAWLAVRRVRQPGTLHYFLWLMLALNLLTAFGYLLFSGIGGFGDWAVFVDDLGPPLLTRSILALVGAVGYFYWIPKIIMPVLNPYLGRDRKVRGARARRLSLLPYLVGGTVFVIAGLFNPLGWELVLLSAAAASFGGTSLLAWYPGGPDRRFREMAPESLAGIPRSWAWIAAALVVAALFIGVLGPGIKL